MMLTPSPRRPWIRRTICIQVRRSWPKVGSSRMSTRGAAARAEAHGQPPFLAAGERVRVLLGVLDEPEPRQQFTRAALRLRLIAPGAQRPEHHLLQYAAARELVLGVLEHVGDAGRPVRWISRRSARRRPRPRPAGPKPAPVRAPVRADRPASATTWILPAPFAPDQRRDLSGGEVEADMLGNGLPVTADGQIPRGQQHPVPCRRTDRMTAHRRCGCGRSRPRGGGIAPAARCRVRRSRVRDHGTPRPGWPSATTTVRLNPPRSTSSSSPCWAMRADCCSSVSNPSTHHAVDHVDPRSGAVLDQHHRGNGRCRAHRVPRPRPG